MTGASSGIGWATARALATRGAKVIAVARRQGRLEQLVEELGGEPHSFVCCDVSDLNQVRSMARAASEITPRLDVLVNGAGIPGPGPIQRATSEELEQVIRTNLLGPIWCTKELLPLIERASRSGRTPAIVNVASMAGRIALPRSAGYTATKFGLVGFSESVWDEMSVKGIRTILVNPGFTQTEGFSMDPLLRNPALRWTVMGPNRVAEAICAAVERGSFEVRVQWWWNLGYYFTLVLGPLRRLVVSRVSSEAGNVGENL
ncbi:MAG: SDR family oxidoreductase [Actinomycetota bacterium]|nr:SDR family oxidoreductase [Actinomycetota bacterium]